MTVHTGTTIPVILVYRIGQLGDTLIALPAISLIRNQFPHHRLLLLTDRHSSKNGYISSWDVFEPLKWFDDVFFYEPKPSKVENIKNMFTLYLKLNFLKLDHVFDLSPTRTSKQAMRDKFFFQRIVGTKNYHQSPLLSFPICLKNGKLPFVMPEWQRLLNIVYDATIHLDNRTGHQFVLSLPENSIFEARSMLNSCHLKGDEKIIGIAPGSKMMSKRWSVQNYYLLGKQLLDRFQDIQIVILGGKEDDKIGEELCLKWGKRSHNLAGRLSIYGSTAILKKCVCYIGNDTGTMHLAGMAGTQCVAIFCARDYPGKWEPYGLGHTILRTETQCAGCRLENCPNGNACLNQITVDQVFTVAEEIIHT